MACSDHIQPPLRFTAKADSIAGDAQLLVQHARQLQDELAQRVAASAATFSNVVVPLAHMENGFALQSNILSFYQHVSDDDQIRDASMKAQTTLDNFSTESLMRQDIFTLISAVRDKTKDLDEESSLLLESIYNKHIQTGVGLRDENSRQQFRAIKTRLGQITASFRETLRRDQTTISFSSAELEGVPDNILARLEAKGEKNEYLVVLSNPGHMEVLSYAKSSKTRKRLFIASQNRCSGNVPLLKEAVVLRQEAAHILGFPNNASLRLSERMAKTPGRVNDFLADLYAKLAPAGLDYLQQLKDIKTNDLRSRKEADPHGNEFFLWDYQYYHRLVLEQRLSIDRKMVMEYFPIQKSIAGMMEIFAQLFGLEFIELRGENRTPDMAWHEDTQIFRVNESHAHGGEFLGYLYLDLFHRSGKYPQASCFNLQPVSQTLQSVKHSVF